MAAKSNTTVEDAVESGIASEIMADSEKQAFDDTDGEQLAADPGAASSNGDPLTTAGETVHSTNSGSKILAPTMSPPLSMGWVAAFSSQDLSRIRGAMKTDAWPIRKAGVFPTRDMIELFCSYFPPGIPYGFILARLNEISKLSTRYFLCRMNDTVGIADAIDEVRGLSIEDRILCCYAPVSTRRAREMETMVEMAHCIANQAGGGLLELKTIDLDLLDRKPVGDREALQELELLHKSLVLYNWMSYRFPGVFGQRPLAGQTKRLTEDAINEVLAMLSLPEGAAAPQEPMAKYYRGPPVMAIPELAKPEEKAPGEFAAEPQTGGITTRGEFSAPQSSKDDGLYDVTIGKGSQGEAASVP